MKKLTLLAVSALLLAACASTQEKMMQKALDENSGGDVNVDADGSMQINTSEGSFTMGKSEVPKDWPSDAPIYAGASVQYSASVNADGSPGSAVILVTTDDVATVVAYYKAELTKQGWTMEGAMEGGGTSIIGASKDDRSMSLSITTQNNQTVITIGVGKK